MHVPRSPADAALDVCLPSRASAHTQAAAAIESPAPTFDLPHQMSEFCILFITSPQVSRKHICHLNRTRRLSRDEHPSWHPRGTCLARAPVTIDVSDKTRTRERLLTPSLSPAPTGLTSTLYSRPALRLQRLLRCQCLLQEMANSQGKAIPPRAMHRP